MTSFSDDFNRADGAPGANWVDGTGLWTIVSNQLSPGTAGGTVVIRAATAMATSDNSAQITIASTGAVSHGVWCRGNTGFTQGYLWRNDGTSWNLFSNVGGSFTSIGSFAGAAVAGDTAKVTAVGSTITGYVNGIARVTVTNTAVTTGTSVGLRAESSSLVKYDDFSATDVASGTTASAGTASATATGYDATAAVSGLPGQAVAAADAGAAPASIGASAGQAVVTADANTSGSSFAASAGASAATADVLAPLAALTVLPPETAAQADAYGASSSSSSSTSANAETAQTTADAGSGTVALSAVAESAPATATAADPAPSLAVSAAVASSTADAFGGTGALAAQSGTVAAAADTFSPVRTDLTVLPGTVLAETAASDAAVAVSGQTLAPADVSAVSASALDAGTVLQVFAGTAFADVSAFGALAVLHRDAAPGTASATVSVFPALSLVGAVPGTAGAQADAPGVSLSESLTTSRERVSGRRPDRDLVGAEPGGARGRAPVSSGQGTRPVGRVSGREPGNGQ